MEIMAGKRGYPARVNGDLIRLTYSYGARYEKEGYEPIVHAAYTSRISTGMTVLDVGAHVGFFTLAAALRVGPKGRVFAFEPAPETAAVLQRHIRMNGFEDRVEVVRYVVADHEGEIDFYVRGKTMAAALFRESIEILSPERSNSPAEGVRTRTVTIDKFCAGRGVSPDRIKIDVEGAELFVLRGASATLAGGAEILCEIHPNALNALACSLEDVEALLRSQGRQCVYVSRPNRLGIYHVLSRRHH